MQKNLAKNFYLNLAFREITNKFVSIEINSSYLCAGNLLVIQLDDNRDVSLALIHTKSTLVSVCSRKQKPHNNLSIKSICCSYDHESCVQIRYYVEYTVRNL